MGPKVEKKKTEAAVNPEKEEAEKFEVMITIPS